MREPQFPFGKFLRMWIHVLSRSREIYSFQWVCPGFISFHCWGKLLGGIFISQRYIFNQILPLRGKSNVQISNVYVFRRINKSISCLAVSLWFSVWEKYWHWIISITFTIQMLLKSLWVENGGREIDLKISWE